MNLNFGKKPQNAKTINYPMNLNKIGLGFRLGEQGEELAEGGFPAPAGAHAALAVLIERGGIGTPIMDVVWAGGVTAVRKVAALAEAASRPLALHDCSGPVTLAVSAHLALSLRNVREQEIARGFYYNWYQDLVDYLPPIVDGMISVPDGPGLGLDLLPDLAGRADAVQRVSKL